MNSDDFKFGVYEHYKGNKYRALMLARLEREGVDGELQVIYAALYDQFHIWIRPFSEFTGMVVQDNREQPRFQFLHS